LITEDAGGGKRPRAYGEFVGNFLRRRGTTFSLVKNQLATAKHLKLSPLF